MQSSALVFTVLAPLLLWALCRRFKREDFRLRTRRALALGLLFFELSETIWKVCSPDASSAHFLPMHLCDWVLLAVAGALWFRWQLGFELGYFWGLAGTAQALFTPAIDDTQPWWRLFSFFFSHALIIVSVLHLLLNEGFRPWLRSFPRLLLCSELYLLLALLTNWLTGGNYGFLAAKPSQPSLLDYFSDTPWLYVLQINALAFAFFPLLYLPWLLYDWRKTKAA